MLDTSFPSETMHLIHSQLEEYMRPARTTMMRLLDRSLIGLIIFLVMVLLGIQAVHAG